MSKPFVLSWRNRGTARVIPLNLVPWCSLKRIHGVGLLPPTTLGWFPEGVPLRAGPHTRMCWASHSTVFLWIKLLSVKNIQQFFPHQSPGFLIPK